jgi:hypothetical protein
MERFHKLPPIRVLSSCRCRSRDYPARRDPRLPDLPRTDLQRYRGHARRTLVPPELPATEHLRTLHSADLHLAHRRPL